MTKMIFFGLLVSLASGNYAPARTLRVTGQVTPGSNVKISFSAYFLNLLPSGFEWEGQEGGYFTHKSEYMSPEIHPDGDGNFAIELETSTHFVYELQWATLNVSYGKNNQSFKFYEAHYGDPRHGYSPKMKSMEFGSGQYEITLLPYDPEGSTNISLNGKSTYDPRLLMSDLPTAQALFVKIVDTAKP